MNTQQLNNAINCIIEKLKEGEYSENIIKFYSKVYKNLKIFIILNKSEIYNSDVGLKFLESYNSYSKNGKASNLQIRAIIILNNLVEKNILKFNTHILTKKKIKYLSCYEELLNDYRTYLSSKIFTENVIKANIRYVKKFLFYLEEVKVLKLEDLKKEHFYDFFEFKLKDYDVNSRSVIGNHLRTFISYLNEKEYFKPTKFEVFPVLKRYYKKDLPCFFSKDEIKAMLNSIDKTSILGKRDYAILLLAATYGIRACDINNLKISSIDWSKDIINFTQQKTKKFITFPLTENVKFVLLDYIKTNYKKIQKEDFIFLSLTPPYERLTTSTYRNILRKYALASEIKINGRRLGLHSLRHSVAKNMLDDNIPLTTIKEVLGHSSIVSTNQYIGINYKELKKISLEVPNDEN